MLIGLIVVTNVTNAYLSIKFLYLRRFFMNMSVNLRSFKQRVRHRKQKFITFLSKLETHPPSGLDGLAVSIDKSVWKEIDCTTCANCCKTMTPTYTEKDIKRISAHLKMSPKEFKAKWLLKDKEGDWLNKSTPCQFLDMESNRCNIYEVRPVDCIGFPHFTKKKMVDYMHVHQQNLASCPATFKMVERMMMLLHKKK
jgi:Fe-S-cluster containining protein